MKYIIPLLIGGNLIFSAQTSLQFYPQISSQYFSSGSILHSSNSGATFLTNFGLGASKQTGAFTINGLFQFTSAKNLDLKSTYLNPDLNLEHQRDYFSNEMTEITWFESSMLDIQYTFNDIVLSFGKINRHWGTGRSNLILSNNVPSFPQAGFTWQLAKNLSLEYFSGLLASQIEDTTNSNYNNDAGQRKVYTQRSITGHRLIWEITPTLSFAAMETVIFGNRSIDFHYLLPFIPFWSMQRYVGDTDNIQMSGEIVWEKTENFQLFGALFVDEWRPEWTFKDKNRNWIGYQVGFIGSNILKEKDQIQLEYTWTDHRVYRHRFNINDSYSYDYSLGFWAGPHAEELYLSYNTQFNGIDVSSSFSHLKRGELTGEMLVGQYNNIYYDRYSGNTESRNVASIKGTKGIFNNRVFIRVGCNWIDWTNPGFNPFDPNRNSGKDFSKISLNIGITAKTTFSLD